jgi:hypothetical protein
VYTVQVFSLHNTTQHNNDNDHWQRSFETKHRNRQRASVTLSKTAAIVTMSVRATYSVCVCVCVCVWLGVVYMSESQRHNKTEERRMVKVANLRFLNSRGLFFVCILFWFSGLESGLGVSGRVGIASFGITVVRLGQAGRGLVGLFTFCVLLLHFVYAYACKNPESSQSRFATDG